MNEAQSVDLFVIGAGSGGLAAAKRAASYGARVAIAEDDRVGGTCVIRGCVPKKLMVYASQHAKHRRVSRAFGWSDDPGAFSWPSLVAMRNAEVSRLESIHERNLERAGAELVRGRGRLLDAHTVAVGDRQFRAEHILIATGARPTIPTGDFDAGLTSDDFFDLDEMPHSVILVGGGYIAAEFAGILNSLGCKTTILVRSELLRTFDDDVQSSVAAAMRQQGIELFEGSEVVETSERDGEHWLTYRDTDGMHRTHAETCVVLATGRRPATDGLGLSEVGVQLGARGQILVDEHHVTDVPHIYAVGDVTDLANLTPVAIHAGRTLADRVFGGKDGVVDYGLIATAVFSNPPVGAVGLTETAAREAFGDQVAIYRARFAPMAYTGLPADEKLRTMMKLVVHQQTDRVLGVHMVGDDAPEIIQTVAIALQAGATKRHFDDTVAVHPTAAEELVLMYTPVAEP